jgi:hypothetical protein
MAPLRSVQNPLNGRHDLLKLSVFGSELATASGGQRVIAGAASVLGLPPLPFHPAIQEKSLEGRVEGALADLQDVFRDPLDVVGDPVPVHRPESQGFEDQEVEGAGEKVWCLSHRLSMEIVRQNSGHCQRRSILTKGEHRTDSRRLPGRSVAC